MAYLLDLQQLNLILLWVIIQFVLLIQPACWLLNMISHQGWEIGDPTGDLNGVVAYYNGINSFNEKYNDLY